MPLCVCVRLRRDGQRFLTARWCLFCGGSRWRHNEPAWQQKRQIKTKREQSTRVCFVRTSAAEVSNLPWKEVIELIHPSVIEEWAAALLTVNVRVGRCVSEVSRLAVVWQTWNVHEIKLASHFQMSKVLAIMRLSWLWMEGISGRDTVVSSRHLVVKQRQSNSRQVFTLAKS